MPAALGTVGTRTCSLVVAHPAPGWRAPDPTKQGQQQRRLAPASAAAATVVPLPCKAHWLSKRKAEKPRERRAAGHRESAIPRKT